jgi:hypothetical protein
MKKRSESSFRENKIPNCRNEGKQEVKGNSRTWEKKGGDWYILLA